MKVIETLWFSNPFEHLGIVLCENEVGEKKAYLRTVIGLDSEADVISIMNYGAKIHPEQAKMLYEHLTK